MEESQFNFAKQIDLRILENRPELIKQMRQGNSLSEEEVLAMLGEIDFILAHTKIKGPLVIYPPGILSIETGENRSTGISFSTMIELGKNLAALKDDAGFADLLSGLSNPTQIMDTIFEIEIAIWCKSRPSIHGISFSPEVEVRGKMKRPEFVLQTVEGEVYCECKSLHPEAHASSKRFARIFQAICDAKSFPHVPDNLRIDVHLDDAIKGNQDEQIELLTSAISKSIESQNHSLQKNGAFSFKITSRAEPSPFPNFNMAHMSLVLPKDVSTQVHIKNAKFRISFEDHKLTKRIGNLMNDAKSQLPEGHKGVIFIQLYQSHGKAAKEACDIRFKDSSYSHVLAIGIWGSGNVLHYRTNSTDLVSKIFSL